jgi:hypothetical protein
MIEKTLIEILFFHIEYLKESLYLIKLFANVSRFSFFNPFENISLMFILTQTNEQNFNHGHIINI